jgi:hypothetical protein
MDKQWLKKNASYMDFNVSSCIFNHSFECRLHELNGLTIVMALTGGTEVNESPAGAGAYAR